MLEVVDPDVAAVDDPGEQPLIAEAALLGDELGVVAAAVLVDRGSSSSPVDDADEVQADALDRQVAQHAVGVADVVEVGLDHDPRPLVDLAELLVGEPQRVELALRAVLDEAGLVELDPGGALLGEPLDHLAVDLDQRLDQAERVEVSRATPSAGLESSRKLTGPISTGTVSMPSSSIASACSSKGFELDSEKRVSGPSSGTRKW